MEPPCSGSRTPHLPHDAEGSCHHQRKPQQQLVELASAQWTIWATDALPGAAQGFVGVLVGHPLDTVKTRMQTDFYHHHHHSNNQGNPQTATRSLGHTPSFLAVGSRMVREEGVRSLYRGFVPPLLMMTVKRAVQMTVFASLQNRWVPNMQLNGGNSSGSLGKGSRQSSWLEAAQPFFSGACAGAGGTVVGCPMHVLKIQTQNVPRTVTRNAWDCLVHILRTDGPTGLYRGLPHHLVKDTLFGSCYLGLYSTCKVALSGCLEAYREAPPRRTDALRGHPPSLDIRQDNHHQTQQQRRRERLLVGFLCGSAASSITWVLLYPIDSVKTRIQARGATSAREALRSCGGVRWLYRGLGAALVRAGPVNGCSMLAYEGAQLALGTGT